MLEVVLAAVDSFLPLRGSRTVASLFRRDGFSCADTHTTSLASLARTAPWLQERAAVRELEERIEFNDDMNRKLIELSEENERLQQVLSHLQQGANRRWAGGCEEGMAVWREG